MKMQKALFNIGLYMMVIGAVGAIIMSFFTYIEIATYSLAVFLVGYMFAIFNASDEDDKKSGID